MYGKAIILKNQPTLVHSICTAINITIKPFFTKIYTPSFIFTTSNDTNGYIHPIDN